MSLSIRILLVHFLLFSVHTVFSLVCFHAEREAVAEHKIPLGWCCVSSLGGGWEKGFTFCSNFLQTTFPWSMVVQVYSILMEVIYHARIKRQPVEVWLCLGFHLWTKLDYFSITLSKANSGLFENWKANCLSFLMSTKSLSTAAAI